MRKLCFTVAIGLCAAAFGSDVVVKVNGTPVNFADAPPRLVGHRVLVPLRGVFEQMGAKVDWQAATSTVTAQKGSILIKIKVGSPTAIVDETNVPLDQPAIQTGGTVLVPLRFVSQALGGKVDWDAAARIVSITSKSEGLTGFQTLG